MTVRELIRLGCEYFLRQQFACLCVACLRAARRQARRQAEVDRLDLPARVPAQAGATIKRNLEVLGYGE